MLSSTMALTTLEKKKMNSQKGKNKTKRSVLLTNHTRDAPSNIVIVSETGINIQKNHAFQTGRPRSKGKWQSSLA